MLLLGAGGVVDLPVVQHGGDACFLDQCNHIYMSYLACYNSYCYLLSSLPVH